MKTRRTIEQVVDHDQNVKLEDVKIGEKDYSMVIENLEEGRLTIRFYDGRNEVYKMRIDGEGIDFERYKSRPNHDHDDTESLQIVVNGEQAFQGKGKITWRTRFPHKRDGYDFFRVPFGGIIVDY